MESPPLLSVVVGLMLLSVVVLALKNKILVKMAVRNLKRRPKNTTIVIAGLLVSTAIISGSLVAGDSMNYMVSKATYDALGNVDEEITIEGQYFDAGVYNTVTADADVQSTTDGISPIIWTNIPSIDDATSGITATNVMLQGTDFALDKSLGDFALIDGTHTDATDLGANEVAINDKLARDLNAHTGDAITTYYGVPGASFAAHNFTIKYIAKDEGKALYGLSKTVFMPLAAAQMIVQKPGQINTIRVSNTGNVETGVVKSDEVTGALTTALAGLPYTFNVQPIKQDLLKTARDTGAQISEMFLMLSSFSIIAGAMLIVNIFIMLSEERKSELGMARAVGMKRRHLIQMFVFEGATYAVLAAAIGAVLGLGVGAGLIYGFNTIFAGDMDGSVSLVLHYDLSSLLNAFLIGVILTFVTIVLASFRISKLNIVQAIRNTEEPDHKNGTRRTFLLGCLLLALGIATFATAKTQELVMVLSPSMAIFGAALIARRFVTRERAFTLAGIALVTYILYLNIFPGSNYSPDGMLQFTLSGILLVAGTVLIVLFNSRAILRALTSTLGKIPSLRPILKPAIAYPLNRKFRMGMTVMMFSLVIFVMILGSVTSATFQPDTTKQTGGYDVRAFSVAPIANLTTVQQNAIAPAQAQILSANLIPLESSKIEYYDGLYMTQTSGLTINNQSPQYQGPPFDNVFGIGAGFVQHVTYTFKEMAPGFGSSQDVWNALSDPHNVVVDSSYVYGTQTAVKAGDSLTLTTAQGPATFTVVGVVDEMYLHGIFMEKSTMQQLFPALALKGDNTFLIKVAKDVNPIDVTYDLKKGYKLFGMDAEVIREEVQKMNQQSQMVFQLLEVFLGLGLIIGIASLGVITTRSIIERRQEIGMMRAIGFKRNLVFNSLLIEILFITTVGSVIGLGTGIALSYSIYLGFTQTVSTPFTVPIVQVIATLVVVYVAAVICTIIPARNASKISPAEAVRYIE